MSNPWNAEREWNADEVRSVIRAQCDGVACHSVHLVGCGWDNAAFLVDDYWIFRFAQRRMAIPWLAREWNVLPKLVGRCPVAIPDLKWFGLVDEWTFVGYPQIPGQSAVGWDRNCRSSLARPLGAFLRVLHSQPLEGLQVEPDSLGRFDIPRRRETAVQMLADCDADVDHQLLRSLLDDVDVLQNPGVLSHGDLYSRQILVDQGIVTGIIDWGDVCIAEPAHDLMLAFCFFPAKDRTEFLAAYGPITSSTISRARFRGICHSLHVYRYAKSIGDTALLQEAILSLQFVVE